jgi:hypothetical protein
MRSEPKKRSGTREKSVAVQEPARHGRQRNARDRLVQQLIERGSVAIELVARASSKKEVLSLLCTTNEFAFLMEICGLAIKNLDSEPLGLPGKTPGERRRLRLVRRLVWLVDIGRIERRPNETRLLALWRHLGDKTDSQLQRMIHKLERGKPG